eukprot:gene4093-34964_t
MLATAAPSPPPRHVGAAATPPRPDHQDGHDASIGPRRDRSLRRQRAQSWQLRDRAPQQQHKQEHPQQPKDEKHRETRGTRMNICSSRSHMIFTILLDTVGAAGEPSFLGKIAIIDLAGSERLGSGKVPAGQQAEAIQINKSLNALCNVLENLSKRDRGVQVMIPYKEHKLTRAMQEYFEGDKMKTLMFINISPARCNAHHSKWKTIDAKRRELHQLEDHLEQQRR